jgi:hypothetical protein
VTAPARGRHRLTGRFRKDDEWLPRDPYAARQTDDDSPGRARRAVRKVAALIAWGLLVVATGLGLAGVVVGAVIALIVTINGSLP